MSTPSRASTSEFQFIDWIKSQALERDEITCGIGDDASVMALPADKDLLTAVDVITEGIHFTSESDPFLIGRKALSINLSDLAAMGALPLAAYIGIVLPQSRDRQYAEEIYRGLFNVAREYSVTIAGGDTNSWSGGLVINVTVQGVVHRGQAILRSGARPGDWLFVTGALGGSLPSGRHFRFEPRIRESQILSKHFQPTAMLDISDGLASDIHHLAKQSQVGFVVDSAQLPIHDDVDKSLDAYERLKHALNDGEDFELLFTLPAEVGERLILESREYGLKVTRIGTCTREKHLLLNDGNNTIPLPAGGWNHSI